MIIEAEALKLDGIQHAFFTREGGVSEGIYASLNGGVGSADKREAVAENRRRMAARFGLTPDRLLGLYQIHSPDVRVVDAPWTDGRPKGDGMASRTPGVALGVSSADCGPVLFADAENGVIGACHAGWRGAFLGVAEATLAAMEGLGAKRASTVVVLGPTIGPTAYEVGPEFVARFRDADGGNAQYFAPSPRSSKDDHAMFDLPAYIGMRLKRAGVGTFVDLKLCTYGDEARFFSFRRTTHRGEKDYGRLISAICLR
jgi:YfiH family protein